LDGGFCQGRVIWIKVTRRQIIREIGRNPINRVGADLGEAFPDGSDHC